MYRLHDVVMVGQFTNIDDEEG